MLPFQTAAASLMKSGVDVINRHSRLPALVLAVQLTPLSLDMYIEPALIVAAMYRKSGEAVTPYQSPLTGFDIAAALDGYDPAGTCTHAELPVPLLYVPAAHAVQPLEFGLVVATPPYPAAHTKHMLLNTLAGASAASQAKQAVAPDTAV